MPLSTILQLYRGSQFYLWRKSEYPEKNTDLPLNILGINKSSISRDLIRGIRRLKYGKFTDNNRYCNWDISPLMSPSYKL
jgi:hypothetical protein